MLLGLLFAVSSGLVAVWQRRPGRRVPYRDAGVTLYTSPGCSMCGPVERALRDRGVPVIVRDVTSPEVAGTVRSTPTVVVTDADGTTVLRRSGRAALDDVAVIAAAATEVPR